MSRLPQLAALAAAAEAALADEARTAAGAREIGATRAALEHRLALAPSDAAAAHRLAEFLPPGAVLRDTLAEAAREPDARFAGLAEPLLATILNPGPAPARYAALDQLGPLRLGAEAGLRLRVYRDHADAESLARLREQMQHAWAGPASPEDLPYAVRQGVAFRVTGRIAPWLTELDRGLAHRHAAGAQLALAAAIGDPVRAAKLLDDGRQRLEARLRSASAGRHSDALAAAGELLAPLQLLRRLSPDDSRVPQTETRLSSLLDEAHGQAAIQAGNLAAGLVADRAQAGRVEAAEQLLSARRLLPSQRRIAETALLDARLRRDPGTLPELVQALPAAGRDDLLLAWLPAADAAPATVRWTAMEAIADPGRRAAARVAMVERLLALGQQQAAQEVWEGWDGVDDESLSELTRARVTVLAWRVLGRTSRPNPLAAGGVGESSATPPLRSRRGGRGVRSADDPPTAYTALLDQARAILDYAFGATCQLPAGPGSRCLARTARDELAAALRDGTQAPGPIFGFGVPLAVWSRAARQVDSARWGKLVAAAWSAAMASPQRPLVVEPLALLPAERLADWVDRLLRARAESYREAVRAALDRAIGEVGQGTGGGARSRPR